MAESSAETSVIVWQAPESPFRIETSSRVLDDIRLAVLDAFFSLPRGGAEIGGVLLGRFEPGRLEITDYAALECEHAYGPSFTLSPNDEQRLTGLIAQHAHGPAGTRPVGWYHSHTRSEIFLSDTDLAIHKRFFPEPFQVAMVMKPHTFQPARVGFFFREADGQIRTDAPYGEITLEALPMRPVPAGVPTAAPADDPLLRRLRSESAAAPVAVPAAVPAAAPAIEPPPPPAPPAPEPPPVVEPPKLFVETATASSHRPRWTALALAAAALGAAAFGTRDLWLPRVAAVAQHAPAPPPSLGLNTLDREGQLQIRWDPKSAAVTQARDAVLEISDGGPAPQAIPLDRAHLQTGSFTYGRQSEKVDVKLTIHWTQGADIREVTSFLGKLPEKKEDPEAQKQREEMAKQAAKLKNDLNTQAAKTKKLEKDLQTIREEMRQQQMKRMTNQLPDK